MAASRRGAKRKYKRTARRKAALRKAQLVSAQKRKVKYRTTSIGIVKMFVEHRGGKVEGGTYTGKLYPNAARWAQYDADQARVARDLRAINNFRHPPWKLGQG